MNNFEKQLHTIGQTVRMTLEEKRRIRAALEREMKFAPAREKTSPRLENKWSNNIFFLLLRNPMPIALILALTIGGSISFAAEGALPGDLLYPVKVSVNEEIKETLAFSPEAKAQWESERAERRLSEAASLSAEGKLSAEAEEKIAEQFEKHAQNVAQRVKEFEERDPELASEVTSRFETSLDAHAEILTRLSLRNQDDEDDSTGRMLAVVRGNRSSIDAISVAAPITIKMSAEMSDNSLSISDDSGDSERSMKIIDARESSVLRMLKSAKSKTDTVSKIIKKFETTLSTSTMVQVKSDFTTVTQAITDGKIFLENKQYGEAFAEFQDAFNLAYRLEILLKAEKKHKLQIFPAILPISAEEDNDDDNTATPPVSSFTRVNVYLQKEADRMEEKAGGALAEAQLKLSEKILRAADITDKVHNLIMEAKETSIKAETAYAQEDYTGALRLWNISYANATAASGLLSGLFRSDDESEIRGSDGSHGGEVETETKIETEVKTEDSEIKSENGIKIKIF